MSEIRLDKRLQSVASLVRQGRVLADIGTDHAYLVCYLLQKGIIPAAIAADLRKGPLENARAAVEDCGLSDRVTLILSDGLERIKPKSCDDIAIAGMGGILISEIISKAKWVYDKNIHIIAQPMTHAEVLREFLVTEGFEILCERATTDGQHCYCAISAVYTGKKRSCPGWYAYLGELINNSDSDTVAYVTKVHKTLSKKVSALATCGKSDTKFEETLKAIEEKIKEAGLWQE